MIDKEKIKQKNIRGKQKLRARQRKAAEQCGYATITELVNAILDGEVVVLIQAG